MPNADYWKKRMAAIEESQNKKTREYYEYAQEQFRKTEASIDREIELWYAKLAENNEISLSAAKELLRKDELEEFHWTVEEYIKKGESLDYSDQWREALKNASAKVHINRLEAIKLQVQQECEVLYGNLNDNVDAMLRDIYTEGYYRTAFEIQKGTGVGYAFNQLDTRRVRTAINTSWAQDGKNFSDRLWQNKENLVNSLNETLTQNIIRGENPRKAIEQLSKKLGTSKANAGRLYMTESAAIAAKSQSECYKELDVEEFEFVSTLDTNTCDICGSMDGKHFPMSDYEIGLTVPPLHPNCRCVTVPYFPDDEEEGTRAARNDEGKTYEVPSNMTYEQWKAKYVDGRNKTELSKGKDITNEVLNRKANRKGAVEDLLEYTVDNVTYIVDGKHVVLDYSKKEKHIAEIIKEQIGGNIKMVPRIMVPEGISTPDFLIDGQKYDLKEPIGKSNNVLYNMVNKKKQQASNFVFDISNCPLDNDNLIEQANRLFNSYHTGFIQNIMLIKDDKIIKIIKKRN
jgi:SPP1 gp7 family putative phage head morphogenesis protein